MVYISLILFLTSASPFAKGLLFSFSAVQLRKFYLQLCKYSFLMIQLHPVLGRRKMARCYKLNRQLFPILDQLLHVVHFRDMTLLTSW